MISNKKFANLLQLMTLARMPHFTSPYYDNGNVNEQNSNFNSSSRQLKLTDGLYYLLLLATSTDD